MSYLTSESSTATYQNVLFREISITTALLFPGLSQTEIVSHYLVTVVSLGSMGSAMILPATRRGIYVFYTRNLISGQIRGRAISAHLGRGIVNN